MQINAGSIERDCPESPWRKRAKDRYRGSKEKGKDRGDVREKERDREGIASRRARGSRRAPERVNDDKGRRGALTEDRGKG